ncbi:MAG: hypothetical protein EON85_15395 [Brevundimonas sp.]|nr:MAG: hypothetical protein EON85_15395 [Brevundimonas sp.]
MLSLIALSVVLMQDPPAPPPPPTLEVRSRVVFVGAGGEAPGGLDSNDDGQVTREEFAAPLNDAFGRLDKDNDGRLSREEMAEGPDAGAVTVRRLGDGDVQRFELRRPGPPVEGAAARFERNGAQTRVFVSPEGDGSQPQVVVRTRPGGPRGARIELHAADGPGGRALDKDGDGKISEAEFVSPLREAFARMDADQSGFVEDGERTRGSDVRVFSHGIETQDDE